MIDLDFFDKPDFARQLRYRIEQSLEKAGIEGASFEFAQVLAMTAKANKAELERRTSHLPYGDPDLYTVLESVDKIMEEAISQARRQYSKRVTAVNLTRAIELKYCKIWPFCK